MAPLLIFIIATGVAGVLGGLASDKLDGTARTWVLGILLVIWLGMAAGIWCGRWWRGRPLISS